VTDAVIRAEDVSARLEAVRRRLEKAGGADVTIIAVTKAFGASAIDAAVAAGLRDIGENYAQECVAKLAEVEAHPMPTVHFIGRLQRNKVKRLAGVVDIWQTVDRVEVGREIAKRAPGAEVMIQVDISGEETKGGCPPAEVFGLVDSLREMDLVVTGLMGIGPLAQPEAARPGFRLLRGLVDDLGLGECSMGMSADLEIAVEEGATMVRIGSDLFGPRPETGRG
jgi:pyridoxal phosphate enzyme (YggS family)